MVGENLADISGDTGGVVGMCSSPEHSRLSAAFPQIKQRNILTQTHLYIFLRYATSTPCNHTQQRKNTSAVKVKTAVEKCLLDFL